MPTLYKIVDEMAALEELLIEAGGDISDPQVAEFVDQMFADLGQQLETKIENYCRLIVEVEARAKARKEEADRILARAKTDSNMANGLRGRLLSILEAKNIKKVETDLFRVSVANNGGKNKIALNPEKITQEWLKPEFVPDYDNIRRTLEAGQTLDFAYFEPKGSHLRIK